MALLFCIDFFGLLKDLSQINLDITLTSYFYQSLTIVKINLFIITNLIKFFYFLVLIFKIKKN
jgi:hypothetical protein